MLGLGKSQAHNINPALPSFHASLGSSHVAVHTEPLLARGDTQGRFGSRELSAKVLVPEVGEVQRKSEPRPGRAGTHVSTSPLGLGLASRGG